ncbi:MAG: SH3 domain-containing protein [Chloroflexi bacterium]|nr:SH3 domain-containing protein [Ardenticatenaceae bacterium]MBL1130882.1 hypothetical protein [Chloroflexota bacterium]NOG36981.1 SH3 domain-containing protein [Chloroflexota bacterium]GIK56837.1 MAG: hypothetical protein BroJett015_25000 [Chloroflexota bacterium]
MFTRLRFTHLRPLLGLLSLILLTLALTERPAQAQTTSWHAEYFNNRNLSGSPVFSRFEDRIFHDWGQGSPNPVVNVDDFSARWNGAITLNQGGVWRFVATTDDGMRVFINNSPIIDVWYDSQVHTVTTDIYLAAGSYPVRVEYYEAGGGAIAQFSWSLATTINAWKGEYFNNRSLSNQPVLVRDDANINFEWGTGSPAPGIVPPDDFSVRWTRTVQFAPGTYRFTATTDDGVRLWVNNQLVIDNWVDQTITTKTADFTLSGAVPMRMEYYDARENATARLGWTAVSTVAPPTTPIMPAAVNWDAAYYNNFSLDGSPAMTRIDPQIRFTWGSSSPQPNLVDANNFSVRWSKTLNFSPGTYTFKTTVEGGTRLWVNGQLLIDQWNPQYQVVESAANITLPGGAVPVVMELRKDYGLAQAWLEWFGAGGQPASGTTPTTPALSGNTAVMTGARYLSLRSGPGTEYEAIAYLSHGEVVTLLGRDPFSIWIQVRRSDSTVGWVSGRYLTSNVPYSSLPVVNLN